MKDGVKAVIICDHKLLMFLRDNRLGGNYPLHWQIVGGGIEDGETPEEALIREVKEETSYDIKNFLFLEKVKGSMGENVYRYLIKVADEDKNKFKIGPDEGLEVKSYSFRELFKLRLTPGSKKFIEERKKEFLEWMK